MLFDASMASTVADVPGWSPDGTTASWLTFLPFSVIVTSFVRSFSCFGSEMR